MITQSKNKKPKGWIENRYIDTKDGNDIAWTLEWTLEVTTVAFLNQ